MFIIALFIIAKNGNSPNTVLINEYYILAHIYYIYYYLTQLKLL